MNPRWFVCKTMGMEVWVKATSHGKARYKCLRAAREAGYRLTFPEIHVYVDTSGLPPLPGSIIQ